MGERERQLIQISVCLSASGLTFEASLKVTSITWSDDYQNTTSEAYQELVSNFTHQVRTAICLGTQLAFPIIQFRNLLGNTNILAFVFCLFRWRMPYKAVKLANHLAMYP